ncbi:MAG: acetate kinase, partial [Paracoccaceae bacterium]
GRSVANTMGYSPLDGLTMGTRSGGIDGNAVLRLAEVYGIAEAGQILNRESGLMGLGGSSDMRALQSAGTNAAQFAVAHFVYWVVRHAGSMIAAMGGLDAIAFTGGIGENDAALRAQILADLDWIARDKPVWIIPAEEERQIAAEALALIAAGR